MEKQFGFTTRIAGKPPPSPILSQEPHGHGDGRSPHNLLQRQPRCDQGARQHILTPILKRKITIDSFSQYSDNLSDNGGQAPTPGSPRPPAVWAKVTGGSSGQGLGPNVPISPRPGRMAEGTKMAMSCPQSDSGSGTSLATAQRITWERRETKRPSRTEVITTSSPVPKYKEITIAEAQRQKADLDQLLQKAAVLLSHSSAGQTDLGPTSKLHSAPSGSASGKHRQNSQQDWPIDVSDLKPASSLGSGCSRLGFDLPFTQLQSTMQHTADPLPPPPGGEGLGMDPSAVGPSHKTKVQTILERTGIKCPQDSGEEEPPRDGQEPQGTCRVRSGGRSLIPTKDTTSHSPRPRSDPEGTLRDGGPPTNLHRSLGKDSRSVTFEYRSLIPTREVGLPSGEQRPVSEGVLGLGDRLSPPPTEGRSQKANRAEQEGELPAPLQYRKIRRRMQRGSCRDASAFREQRLPAGSDPENWGRGRQSKQGKSNDSGFTWAPRRRTSPEG